MTQTRTLMRAVRFDRYGGRDVLYLAEVERPEPSEGEVLVAVRAAGINPGEAAIRRGDVHDRLPATFPSGEGSDLAGIVAAVGPGVDFVAVGDEVMGWSWQRSSHAEYVLVPANQLIPKPAELSWEVAGALYVVGVTAYACARAVAAGTGDTIAVAAAGGGVGSFLVQLLSLRGARVVGIASDRQHDWLRAHGVTPVAYGSDLAERIRALTPGGIDAFVDLYGPQYIDLAVELGVPPPRINTITSFTRARQVGAQTEGSTTTTTPAVLAEMASLVAAGQIELPIAATYPLARVQDAYAELEQGHTHGKIVLIP